MHWSPGGRWETRDNRRNTSTTGTLNNRWPESTSSVHSRYIWHSTVQLEWWTLLLPLTWRNTCFYSFITFLWLPSHSVSHGCGAGSIVFPVHSAGLRGTQCWLKGHTVLAWGAHSAGLRGTQCWLKGHTVLAWGAHSAGLRGTQC